MQKDRITVTLSPDLVARIDRLAELWDVSRSRMIEQLLEVGVEEDEKYLKQVGSPVVGSIVQSIMDHPKLTAAIAKLVGDQLGPEELKKLERAAPKLRGTRERLRDERGRRRDLRPEGA